MFLPTKLKRFFADESGPTAVEYAILILLVILVCMLSIQVFGQSLDSSFSESQQRMSNSGLGS